MHRLDGSSLAAAELLANSGFEGAYAIKGGVEGPNGWQVKPYDPFSNFHTLYPLNEI